MDYIRTYFDAIESFHLPCSMQMRQLLNRRKRIAISRSPSITLPLDEKELMEYLQSFLETLGHAERMISLYFTEDHEIRELNRRYRDHDRATDVLSWSYWESDPESEMLGEIVISMDRVKEQARTNCLSEDAELMRLLAHGCAHLVGYDHEGSLEEEKRMLAVEAKMLGKVGFGYIYS